MADSLDECPNCDTRYLGGQRCGNCNTWCQRIGLGGPCPSHEEPVAISDLPTTDQLPKTPISSPKQRR